MYPYIRVPSTAANPRLRKMMFWLETARLAGSDPEAVIFDAQKRVGYTGTVRADADRESLVRNRIILERLGCLDAAGMVALRKGNSPTITKGPYAGDTVDADHIIPRAVAPELDDKIYDLEFMPSKMNKTIFLGHESSSNFYVAPLGVLGGGSFKCRQNLSSGHESIVTA